MRWSEIVGESPRDDDVDHSGEGNFAQEFAPAISHLLNAPVRMLNVRSRNTNTMAVYEITYGEHTFHMVMVLDWGQGSPTKPDVSFILGDDGPEVEMGRIGRDLDNAAEFAQNVHGQLEYNLQGLDYDSI